MRPTREKINWALLSCIASMGVLQLGFLSYLLYSDVSSEHSQVGATASTQQSIPAQECSNKSIEVHHHHIQECPAPVAPSPLTTWRSPKRTCGGKGFQRLLMINSHRYGDTRGRTSIQIMREPFVSCSLTECRHFFLGHRAGQPGSYEAGTDQDRSKFRELLSVELGKELTVDNAIAHMSAWSGSACHDGKNWYYLGSDGPPASAVIRIRYGTQMVESISPNGDTLRLQESECVCTNGSCYAMTVDGLHSVQSIAKFIKLRNGRIVKTITTTGRIKMTEECTCSFVSETVFECACRDNAFTAKRPIVRFDTQKDEAVVNLMCSDTYMDTPRPADGSTIGDCNSDGTSGVNGIKGGFVASFDEEGNIIRYYTRTTSQTLRKGCDLFKTVNTDPWTSKAPIPVFANLIDNAETGTYQVGFKIPGSECDQSCVAIEMVISNVWTSAATAIYCEVSTSDKPWSSVTGFSTTA
uniref:Neuraminidase n=1 Tax=Salamander influenza-like virus TaxID=2777034 RepID=A0A866W071_9ORTO|nr:neuraminidase [Salamander influenza-like virus]